MVRRRIIQAAVNGDIDLLKSLIGYGLTIDRLIGDNYNCLLTACYCNQDQFVSYLIQLGVDMDYKDDRGETAVHVCARYGNLECLVLLVDNGAQVDISSDEQMTPLRLAGARGRAAVVEYLTGFASCSPAANIEALELMGTACVSEGNFQSARDYWSMALEERAKADEVQPKSQETHPVYADTREFHTVEELNRIASSEVGMWFQALVMRERILGFGNSSYYYEFVDKACAYFEARDHIRCISMGMYIIDVQLKNIGFQLKTMVYPLSSLCRVLSLMTSNGSQVTYDQIMPVLVKAVYITDLGTMANGGNPSRLIHDHFKEDILLVLGSIGFIAKCQPQMSEKDSVDFQQVIYEFVHLSPRDKCDRTPLHWACEGSDCPSFPLDVVKLLLEAGANPGAVQHDGRTPLHTACENYDPCFSTLEVVELLLKAGASPGAVDIFHNTPLHLVSRNDHPNKQHVIQLMVLNSCLCELSVCNEVGKLFIDYLPDGMHRKLELPEFYKLQCLSAVAVAKYKIPFESVLPPKLADIVKKHITIIPLLPPNFPHHMTKQSK